MNWLLAAISVPVFVIVVCIPWILGCYLIIVGKRFKKNAHESGVKIDLTAFWTNWLVFVWHWAERVKEIVAAMPFFTKDLTETFGTRPDDGKVT